MPINEKYLAKFESEEYYHIYNRSPSNRKLFLYPDNYFFFLDLIKKHLEDSLKFLSYCLIPNHFHLFAQVRKTFFEKDDVHRMVSEQFRKVFLSYANAFNKKYKTHGALFTTPFKRILVDSGDYFSEVIRYIHHNPVHHKMHPNFESYRYSSYNSLLSDKPTLLERDFVLDWFRGKENFINFHKIEPKSPYAEFPFYIEE